MSKYLGTTEIAASEVYPDIFDELIDLSDIFEEPELIRKEEPINSIDSGETYRMVLKSDQEAIDEFSALMEMLEAEEEHDPTKEIQIGAYRFILKHLKSQIEFELAAIKNVETPWKGTTRKVIHEKQGKLQALQYVLNQIDILNQTCDNLI